MINIELLTKIAPNNNLPVRLEKGTLEIRLSELIRRRESALSDLFAQELGRQSNTLFTGCEIAHIMKIINSAEKKYKNIKFPVRIILSKVEFIDKLTYVFLECICYYLINIKKHPVYVCMDCIDKIQTVGIQSSPLLLLQTGKREDIYKYIDKFRFDIFRSHYRRIVNGQGKEDTNFLGQYGQEIDSFLKPFGIDETCRDKIAWVCTELAGNAVEHAQTECLIDIDVAPGYQKKLEDGSLDGNFYYGINIAIVNFSERLLGDGIENNVLAVTNGVLADRYSSVMQAYRKHQPLFKETYSKVDFCNVTAFQNKVSGRNAVDETGGTGLPKLIKSLQEMSEAYRCYVISGRRCVNFYKNTLIYSKEGWIGFNDENDYFSNIPNKEVCGECLIYMPGTAYNLNFVMQGVEI